MTVTPPQDIHAEEDLLGALLIIDNAIAAVRAEVGLRAEDFYLERHRITYNALVGLGGEGKPTDELMVCDLLGRGDGAELEKAGGRHYISELAAKTKAVGNFLHYAQLVSEKARWRRRLGAAQELQAAALAEDPDVFARAEGMLADDPSQSRSLYDVERQKDLVFDLMEGKAKAEFFWPFPKLNQLQSGGMRRGQLIVLSGYTNEGKSHFAAQLLDGNRKHGRVCLYDNEMDPAEQAARRATRAQGVPYAALMDGKLDDRQRSTVLEYLNGPVHWPIVDTAGWTVDDVALHIRQQRWDFVVVDILHNFPFEDERQIAAAVARLKAAARLANCVIVLVAHVNRGGTQGGFRRRPVRSDLKWSGEIENLADVVCFTYRKQDELTLEPTESGAIYFDKCRGGKLGGVNTRFNPDRLLWELSHFEDPEPEKSLSAAKPTAAW